MIHEIPAYLLIILGCAGIVGGGWCLFVGLFL
jgi:hypothetical protein